MPLSRHRSINRAASFTCVLPHALKKSLPPPKVAVPKLNTGTRSPELPNCLYSITSLFIQPHWFLFEYLFVYGAVFAMRSLEEAYAHQKFVYYFPTGKLKRL